MPLYDETQLPLDCGSKIGSGGEGDVFQLQQTASHCAKIYHKQPLPPEKVHKLRALRALGAPPSDLQQVAAIPLSLLFKHPGGRDPVGVVLPFVDGRDIHDLYNPGARQKYFPRAHLGFLAATAQNLAFAFQKLHTRGIVMGDVNEQNIKVLNDATVRLIDCDSFQISTGTGFFPCPVGSSMWTAPELVGRVLGNAPRTPNQDAFGLAQLIFLLLFAGRYPFAGIPAPGVSLDPNEAIAHFAFAYDPAPPKRLLQPPAHTVRLSDFPLQIGGLFLRAFRAEGARPNGRPSPAEWIAALSGLQKELTVCSRNKAHVFWKGVSRCPWCRILEDSGVDLFPEPFDPSAAGLLWPPDTFEFEEAFFSPVPDALLQEARLVARLPQKSGLDWISAALQRIGVFRNFLTGRQLQDLRREMASLDEALQATRTRLQRLNQQSRQRLGTLRTGAEGSARMLQHGAGGQSAAHAAALAEAERRVREAALNEHLGEAEIDEAEITGIGAGRKRTLRSHGIQTAADLREDRLRGLPGFGAGLIQRLMDWREEIEGEFHFLNHGGYRKQIQQQAAEILRRQSAEVRQKIQEILHAARKLKDAHRAEFRSLEAGYQEQLLKKEVLGIRIEALL
jgi:DNA-binding helix-hairpin-helix protein with protein kinase domain